VFSDLAVSFEEHGGWEKCLLRLTECDDGSGVFYLLEISPWVLLGKSIDERYVDCHVLFWTRL
jgi:hypothetical protein